MPSVFAESNGWALISKLLTKPLPLRLLLVRELNEFGCFPDTDRAGIGRGVIAIVLGNNPARRL